MKKYKRYKDSGVLWLGMVPEHWKVMPMKRGLNIHNGQDYKLIESRDGYPVIGSGGQFAWAKDYLHDGEAVLLGRKGTIDKPRYINGKFWTVDTMFYAVPFGDVSCKYMYYQALGIPFDLYSTNTAVPSMTQSDLANNPFCFPPLSEQHAIVAYLDCENSKINSVITEKEKMINDMEKYRSSLISETVTKGLNPDAPMKDSGVDWIGEVPEHWSTRKLKYCLCEKLQYGASESGTDFRDDFPRYIRITDITQDGKLKDIDKLSLAPKVAEPYLLKDGDILFARSGATVGKTFLYKEQYGESAFAGYLIKASVDTKKYVAQYVYYYTQGALYDQWKNSSYSQATIQNIGADKYSELIIPVPPLEEQQVIVEVLDKKMSYIDSLVSELKSQIENLKSYKQSLITEAVTGQVDVRDWTPNE